MLEQGVHQDLLDEQYQDPAQAVATGLRTMQVLRDWVATRDAEALFHEAQERHAPFGWVLPPERVADNPQLAARDWWQSYRVAGREVRGPGAPYHFSATPWCVAAGSSAGVAGDQLLRDIGWEDAP